MGEISLIYLTDILFVVYSMVFVAFLLKVCVIFCIVGRYVPSQADVAVFEAVSGPPPADLYHALRWYNHIKSYEKEKAR